MQTLWSRVAQAQSACRCRVCLHSTNALSRRAATAASRRRVTGADLFTACYTTILGTAVVIDSKRKGVRRAELDAQLERARASLSTLAVQEAPTAIEADGTQGSWTNEGNTLPKTFSTEEWQASELLEELAKIASKTFVRKNKPKTTFLRHEVDWEQVEAAIAAEEQDPELFLRHPANEKQLAKTTKTVESLVQTLLWRARNTSSDGQFVQERSAGDAYLNEAEFLMEEYPAYCNPHVAPEVSKDARFNLSENFRTLFSKNPNIKEAVGKICFNLLASPAPPNIHNFNTLIAGFHRVQRPDLAEAVIDSYLDSTDWPATQQTIVCLLSHATATDDQELFREIVGRMRGVIGDGMHLRRLFQRPDDGIADSNTPKWAHRDYQIRKYTLADYDKIYVYREARYYVRGLVDKFQNIAGARGDHVERVNVRLTKTAAMIRKSQRLEEKTTRLATHTALLLIKHRTGRDLDPQDVLPSIDWNHCNIKHYPTIFNALSAIDLAKDVSTETKIKEQLLLGIPDRDVARELRATGNFDGLSLQSLVSFYRYRRPQETDATPSQSSDDIVGQLERSIYEIESRTKALLFCYASTASQRTWRYFYPDWHSAPVNELLKYTIEVYVRRLHMKTTEDWEVPREEGEQLPVAAQQDSQTIDESPEPYRYVDIPVSAPFAKSAATGLLTSNQTHAALWSDEQVGPGRYAEAASY
ncbi:hypothetical protein G7054_g7281 [Neopestalotiopsis clavispora]|nr:hypothetical protein G7054_g7281 [Neopestalotiopsis clavispora]